MMRQSGHESENAENHSHFISSPSLPSQQETMGKIVVEILHAAACLNPDAAPVLPITR